MTKRNLRYAGLGLAVLTVGALAACGSSDAPTTTTPPAGTAGAHTGGATGTAGAGTPTAGASTGTAGAGTGTAGAGTGTAGAGTGTAGAGTGAGFACVGNKPTAPLITSFADLVANPTTAGSYTFMAGIPGGTFTYQPAALTLATDGMALNVKGTVNDYDGFGVYLSSCTDASACTGVSFNVKGSVGYTGKLNFRVQSNADTAIDTTNMKGACMVPAGTDSYTACHDSAFDVPVSTAGGVVTVMFSQLAGGVPKAAVTGNDIVGLEWAFNWTAGTTGTGGTGAGGGAGAAAGGATNGPFMADVTIDDVQLVGCTGLTGGAGAGAGGGAATAGAGGASAGASAGGAGGSGGSGGAKAGAGGTGG